MNTNTALKKARELKPAQGKTAAHLYATTEWELTYLDEQVDNPLLSAGEHEKLLKERQDGQAALASLEEKFPDVKAQADEIESPRELSARATRGLSSDAADDDVQPPVPGRHPVARSSSPTPAGGRTTPAPRTSAGASPRRRAPAPSPRARQRRAASRTARSTIRSVASTAGKSVSIVDQATGSWGDEIWTFVLGGFGLCFLYLVLAHPKGLDSLISGASKLTQWVIDPSIDPLRPTTSTGGKR